MTSRSIKAEASFQPRSDYDTDEISRRARQLEELGFDRLFVAEVNGDPFLPLALAAHATRTIEIGTGITVAFARSPMTMAYVGHDLNAYSRGRFRLGLGSQIKPHITKRFSMPWDGAARQMKEFVAALHAIWDTWYDGVPLRFEGESYHHTLMTPMFTPPTAGFERPKILVAGVGPLMLDTAAEVADGLIVHPFCTEEYLKTVIVPRIEPVLDSRGMSLADFEIQFPPLHATGDTEEEVAEARERIRARIGFYASTPAYKPVLDAHGWGDLQPRLNAMTKVGQWSELAAEVPDELLEAVAVVGGPAETARTIRDRFGGIVDSVVLDASISAAAIEEQISILRAD